MKYENQMELKFLAKSENEAFARSVIACFALKLKPNVAQISDIKTAVSEAVTNAIVHGYPKEVGDIVMKAEIDDYNLHIKVIDYGVGIDDVNMAVEPFYTTKPEEERSGMGFTIMESFMDEVKIESVVDMGTKVSMKKTIKKEEKLEDILEKTKECMV